MFYVIEVAIFFFFFCFLLFSIYEIEDLIIIKIRGIKEQMILHFNGHSCKLCGTYVAHITIFQQNSLTFFLLFYLYLTHTCLIFYCLKLFRYVQYHKHHSFYFYFCSCVNDDEGVQDHVPLTAIYPKNIMQPSYLLFTKFLKLVCFYH